MSLVHVGTAGWSIPRAVAAEFPGEGSHLARYARRMRCAEINTSFYRSHRAEVYARWAAQTPPYFRFAVKLPRAITHDQRLRAARGPLTRFLAEVVGLGDRLGVLLVQLPPSLALERRPVRNFFGLLAGMTDCPVVCEPRHASWFEPAADRLLEDLRVGRVAADPARVAGAGEPGGWLGPARDGAGAVLYHRWHGTPRVYYSSYSEAALQARAREVLEWSPSSDRWVVFDNTASGAALADALRFSTKLGQAAHHDPAAKQRAVIRPSRSL